MARALGTSTLPSDATSQDRVALVFNAEDIDAIARKLKKLGAHLLTEPKDYPDWGIRAFHVRDPDGNLIEIEKEMPKREWSQELLKEDTAFHGNRN
jgi:predicted enzyme related to lactoylglutathione lyase